MDDGRDVVVAILAKDKAETLPLYLACLEVQTFPRERMHLYIRANDCVDDTVEILRGWVDVLGPEFKSVTADYSDIGGLGHYGPHEWDPHRFSVLGRIRQDSVDHARRLGCHYFVADLDNFFIPTTLQNLVDSGLPVVAPMLRTAHSSYSNFFNRAAPDGYAVVGLPEYFDVLEGRVRGFIQVDVVHCTYFCRAEVLDHISYDDGSERFEYAIFSDVLRNRGIPQYVDNRQIYGLVGFLGGESVELWGGFDADDFAVRLRDLARLPVRVVNDGTPYG